MKMSLREQAKARAALSGFFEWLWPGPDCPDAEPRTLSFEELYEMEQRYHRAQRTGLTLKQGASVETGASGVATAPAVHRMD